METLLAFQCALSAPVHILNDIFVSFWSVYFFISLFSFVKKWFHLTINQ